MRRPTSAAASNRGFTLVEALTSLAILAVVVSVIVSVHLNTLRAEEFSRLRDGAVRLAGTARTGVLLGTEPKSIIDGIRQAGWRADAGAVGESADARWSEWKVASSNDGAPVVIFYMRPAAVPGADEAPAGKREGMGR